MNILFLHQNFPGQFVHLAPALAKRGHKVVALTMNRVISLAGVQVFSYRPSRGSSKEIHPFAADFETKVIRAEACAIAMSSLKQQGFTPHIVIAHPGWGEALFVKDIFPQVKLLSFLEFFYYAQGSDFDFDPEFAEIGWKKNAAVRIKNANNFFSLDLMDHGYTPTYWQRNLQPAQYHDKISVIHDGIDTDKVSPDSQAALHLPEPAGGGTLSANDEILTFVNRNLEPFRGYHIFMRALAEIQRQRPKLITLIVGGDQVSYGAPPSNGKTWKEIFFKEVKDQLDLSRIFFLGQVAYDTYLSILKISTVHVYLTYPFVLSWSLLEALSMECLVVASKTPPVEEVIQHQHNGLLVDFFDVEGLSNTVSQALSNPGAYHLLKKTARQQIIKNYDLKTVCLPRQIALVESLYK